MTERFLTTTESAAWLLENYGMIVPSYTLRRLARAKKLTTHRAHDGAWYTFSREVLAAHAESQGFRPLS